MFGQSEHSQTNSLDIPRVSHPEVFVRGSDAGKMGTEKEAGQSGSDCSASPLFGFLRLSPEVLGPDFGERAGL